MITRDANHEQIALWNGPRGFSWVAEQEIRDRALAPFGDAALAAAAAQPGEHVLDIGCGCGATCLRLAEAVGAEGNVVGLDVSEAMLARARERAASLRQVRFVQADAACVDAASAGIANVALLFSRFGVMFFDEPISAFKHLRRVLSPKGRLVFVCWRSLAENEWMSVPFEAARAVVTPKEAPAPLDAPGALAFADPHRVRTLLNSAGFEDIALTPFDHLMPLGNGQGLDAAAAEALTLGPASRLVTAADERAKAAATTAVRAALEPYARGAEVNLKAGAWVVSAR